MPRLHPALPDQRAVNWIERLTNRGCFAVDADRSIIAMGPLAERITGSQAEEVLQRHCLSAVRCHRCVEGCGVMERGLIQSVPLTLFRNDGTTMPIRKSGVAVYDDAGEIVGAVELIWEDDGTEQSTDALAADQSLDRILTALGRWYVATDRSGVVLRFSEALPAALGYAPELLQELPIEKLLGEALFGVDAEFRTAVMAGERRAYNSNQIFRNPAWRKVDKDGAFRTLGWLRHWKAPKEIFVALILKLLGPLAASGLGGFQNN